MASALMSSFQKKDVWLPTNLSAKPIACRYPSRADFGARRAHCGRGPLQWLLCSFLSCPPRPLATGSPLTSYQAPAPVPAFFLNSPWP